MSFLSPSPLTSLSSSSASSRSATPTSVQQEELQEEATEEEQTDRDRDRLRRDFERVYYRNASSDRPTKAFSGNTTEVLPGGSTDDKASVAANSSRPPSTVREQDPLAVSLAGVFYLATQSPDEQCRDFGNEWLDVLKKQGSFSRFQDQLWRSQQHPSKDETTESEMTSKEETNGTEVTVKKETIESTMTRIKREPED